MKLSDGTVFSSVSISLNSASQCLPYKADTVQVQDGFIDIEVADLNDDGFADLIATYSDKVDIFENDGNGKFFQADGQSFSRKMAGYEFIRSVDIDQNGISDLILTKKDEIDIFIKEKDNQFHLIKSFKLESTPLIVETRDLDGDRQEEIFIVDTKGRLLEFDNYLLPSEDQWCLVHGVNLVDAASLKFVDLDNDGDEDISIRKQHGGGYVFYWEYPGFYSADIALSSVLADHK